MAKSNLYKKLFLEYFSSKRIIWSFILTIVSLIALTKLPSGILTWIGFLCLADAISGLIEAVIHPMGVHLKDRSSPALKSILIATIGFILLKINGFSSIYFGQYLINWLYVAIAFGLIGGIFNFDKSMERIRRRNNIPRANLFLDNQIEQENISQNRFISCFAIKAIINGYKPKQLQKLWNKPLIFKTKVVNAIAAYWNRNPGTPLEDYYESCDGNTSLLYEQIDWDDLNYVWQMCKKELDFIEVK